MPTTRRSTGRAGPTKGQSTISFHHKVTKASAPQDAKKAVLSAPAVAKVEAPAEEKPVEEEIVANSESASEDEQEEAEVVEPVPEKSEAEVKAEKLSDAQINKYWKSVENERIAPRVHQKDLSTSEKVLRYFDVSSQYGVSPRLIRPP
jgi:DNA polymerase delta subunit 4